MNEMSPQQGTLLGNFRPKDKEKILQASVVSYLAECEKQSIENYLDFN